MKELEGRVKALEDWMSNTRRVEDPSTLQLDGHIWEHRHHCNSIKELRRELVGLADDVEAMMITQGKIKRALLTLFSYGEIHPLIEELNKE